MIQVKAKRKRRMKHQSVSQRMPRKFDFNFCPVNQTTQSQFELENANPYPVKFHFNENCPFIFEPAKGTMPPDCIQKVTIKNRKQKPILNPRPPLQTCRARRDLSIALFNRGGR